MALTESTVVVDEHGEKIEERERRLYSLAELKRLDEENSEEIESGAYNKALSLMAEWATDDPEWVAEAPLEQAREMFAACGITVPLKTEKIYPKGPDGKFLKGENGQITEKWITREDSIYSSWDIYRREFSLNRRAIVDEKKFLRALKWYLAGNDIRKLPELNWGVENENGIAINRVAAVGSQIRKLDLRSRDARQVREQGLVIAVQYTYGGNVRTREFDFDYHYDLSEQFMADANELLSDLHDEALRMISDEYEYRESEEALLEDAEANEVRFDKHGGRA